MLVTGNADAVLFSELTEHGIARKLFKVFADRERHLRGGFCRPLSRSARHYYCDDAPAAFRAGLSGVLSASFSIRRVLTLARGCRGRPISRPACCECPRLRLPGGGRDSSTRSSAYHSV